MLDNPLFRALYDISRDFDADIQQTFMDIKESYTPVYDEVFECIKGDYKTTLHCKFNKNGYLIGTTSKVEKIEVPKEQKLAKLNEQLSKAVAAKDWKLAGEIQREIDNL